MSNNKASLTPPDPKADRASRLDAGSNFVQTAAQQPETFPWLGLNDTDKVQETTRIPRAVKLKIEYLATHALIDGKRPSKNSLMAAGIEQLADKMLLDLGIPPEALITNQPK